MMKIGLGRVVILFVYSYFFLFIFLIVRDIIFASENERILLIWLYLHKFLDLMIFFLEYIYGVFDQLVRVQHS